MKMNAEERLASGFSSPVFIVSQSFYIQREMGFWFLVLSLPLFSQPLSFYTQLEIGFWFSSSFSEFLSPTRGWFLILFLPPFSLPPGVSSSDERLVSGSLVLFIPRFHSLSDFLLPVRLWSFTVNILTTLNQLMESSVTRSSYYWKFSSSICKVNLDKIRFMAEKSSLVNPLYSCKEWSRRYILRRFES